MTAWPKSVRTSKSEPLPPALLLAAADNSPHGLLLERSGRAVYANPAYLRFSGRRLHQLLGKPIPKTFRRSNGHAPAADPAALDADYEFSRVDFSHGRDQFVLHLVRDVTEQRQIRESLRRAQKLEPLGRLVGAVAHDFNNILTAIGLYTDLLLESCGTNAGQRANLAQIRSATDHGCSLIRQLLAFARQRPTEPDLISLNTVVLGMKDMLQRLMGENVEMFFQCSPDLGCVRADPAQMQEVLLNLLTNAQHAMPRGGRVVIATRNVDLPAAKATARHGSSARHYVCLSVSDNGCGMTPEVKERLFEPFFTTRHATNGTGLGLSTVYGIVAQSGGTINVESEPGKGATITILLPRARGLSRASRPGTSARAARTPARETVLLVEDQKSVLAATARMLAQHGFQLLAAGNGQEALRLSDEHPGPIHLLLTDMVMPGMSGEEVAAAIRLRRAQTKVLFVSGYPQRPQAADAAFLPKPFTRGVLLEKIREVLDLPATPPQLSPLAKTEAVCTTEPS